MVTDKWKQRREIMFPEIKDWTDPQNDKRFQSNVKEMEHQDWLWFHPSAYHLLTKGGSVIALLLFLFGGIYFAFRGIVILSLLFFFFGSGFCILLYKQIKMYKLYKDTNMFDIFMREM